MEGRVADAAGALPTPHLRRYVGAYSGIRFQGFSPGTHRGLPSRHLTVVVSLDGRPLRVGAGRFTALAAGLHVSPARIEHDGSQHAISLELTPAGARSLLGLPAAELAHTVVELDELLGREASELAERIAAAPDWRRCFAVLDDALIRISRTRNEPSADMPGAWHRILESGGRVRVTDLAREAGYSRRHLTKRFAREYGLTPKQAARVVRFERSWLLLRRLERSRRTSHEGPRRSLADVAASCGFYDQAHLAREWNELAGCPPSVWLADEELPFVQDAADKAAVLSAT
jgi:AraC-like DNA-binding protein